jgi:hypothetical protein
MLAISCSWTSGDALYVIGLVEPFCSLPHKVMNLLLVDWRRHRGVETLYIRLERSANAQLTCMANSFNTIGSLNSRWRASILPTKSSKEVV